MQVQQESTPDQPQNMETSPVLDQQQTPAAAIPNNIAQQQQPSQQAHSIYFKKLLERYASKADSVQSFTLGKQQQFHQEIMQGRYEIKQRQWSAQQEKLRNSRSNALKNTGAITRSKKLLEDQTRAINGQIQENEEKCSKEMTEQQRFAFLKKMEKEKKELAKKKEENTRLTEEKKIEEWRRAKELLEKEEAERKQKKQQEIAQRLKNLQQLHKRKEEEFKNQTLILKQKMKQKTGADRIEQKYTLQQRQSLDERKKRLAEIRMLHKPIDRKQLDAHAAKFQQLHAQRLAAASANSEKNIEKASVAHYKSIFYKRVQEQQKIFIDKKNEQDISRLRQNRDRLKKFSEQVREQYKPSIDEKKVEELKFRSVSFRNRSHSSVKQKDIESAQKIGLRYLEYSKMQVEHVKLLASNNQPVQGEEEKASKLDYLAQLRKKNKKRTSESAHELLNKLDKISITKEEKAKKILQFTTKIEQAAKRKEQLQKIGNGPMDDHLDSLYLEAIQAKLGLLDL